MGEMTPQEGTQPATKADLWALRDELRFEFRSDLGSETHTIRSEMQAFRAELKVEIAEFKHNFTVELIKTNIRIDHLEQNLREEMRKNTDQIMGAIAAFAQKAEAYDQKALSHGDMLQQHESKLRDHEKRIGSLETEH